MRHQGGARRRPAAFNGARDVVKVRKLHDYEIKDRLREIGDDEDVRLTRWEIDFCENVGHKCQRSLSPAQRESALELIERYDSGELHRE